MTREFDLVLGGRTLKLGRETKIMGVLNVTPDSFSDGGRFRGVDEAERRALEMEEEGAHIVDVGGESTRPGAKPVSWREEWARVRPVLKRLKARLGIPLSIDTSKYEVASAALDEGATLVNDVRALRGNKRLAKKIAQAGAAVCLMHMRGTPRTMQKRTGYRNLLAEIRTELKSARDFAMGAGIPKSGILLDPGFGFGKTPEQNLELLANLDFFVSLGCPILAGLSRKSFIGHLTGAPVGDRLYGSLGAAAAAIYRGAHVLRVHDVAAHRQMAGIVDGTLLRTNEGR